MFTSGGMVRWATAAGSSRASGSDAGIQVANGNRSPSHRSPLVQEVAAAVQMGQFGARCQGWGQAPCIALEPLKAQLQQLGQELQASSVQSVGVFSWQSLIIIRKADLDAMPRTNTEPT